MWEQRGGGCCVWRCLIDFAERYVQGDKKVLREFFKKFRSAHNYPLIKATFLYLVQNAVISKVELELGELEEEAEDEVEVY